MAIDLRKQKKAGRPKGSKTKIEKNLVQPVNETTLTKEDFDVAVETIKNLQQHIEYWKELAEIAGENADKWVDNFDNLARQQEQLQHFIKTTVSQLKSAFSKGVDLTGQIAIEDVNYHFDLLVRMIDHRFFKENKEDN